MQSGTTASRENIFTDSGQHITADGLIIVCCNTFRSPSANPFWNSSLPRDRRTDSLWGYSKVHIRGQRSSPAGPANSGAGSNSPGGCSADSGSALRGSCGSWTASGWVSRSRRTRTRKKSPVASSCCDPLGCRTSVTPVRSREPGREEDMVRINVEQRLMDITVILVCVVQCEWIRLIIPLLQLLKQQCSFVIFYFIQAPPY